MAISDEVRKETDRLEQAISEMIRESGSGDPEPRRLQMGVGVIQVVLAEKRTSLAVLRTGITVAVVPLSITTVLVTLSRFYDWLDNLHFLIPMYSILTILMAVSFYLMGRSIRRIRAYDKMVAKVGREIPALGKYLA